ncbi:uncharacterized protein FIBRA_03388 [Fibroporia radiculosa]|uniref:Peptidase M20 dimerisation domain-containing protein n=1 Tax=Fibroporia radiculosa TaxID=599839 RepID=J4G5B1_9APHY|nr:uncharacterized protein FIBRA_03388 [Fibroporia radiculosa]CCM01338.1 predicted protein [Fibroporia radiculosa]
MPAPSQFISYVDTHVDSFIQRLGEAVAIPSISASGVHRKDVFKMGSWLQHQLNALGVQTKSIDLGRHVMDGQDLPLPPVILGKIGNDSKKKTVLIYGHYDVQPAEKSDGWDTEPFTLVVEKETGRLIGRGSTDDKGPILGWLNVLEAHQKLGLELPVNLCFCFEGMEESGSQGLDELIISEAAKGNDGWFVGVDCVCISDNYWLNTRTPCITYGLRGIAYFKLTVSGPTRDLHSGAFGRTVHEPMTDLILLMSKLVAPDGTILVPGVDDMVSAASAEERSIYDALDYDIKDIEEAAGARIALSSDKATVLMGRMRSPSLSLHNIEGGASAKTWGMQRVLFTSTGFHRLVPPQTPEKVEPLVISYLQSEFAKLNSKNKLNIEDARGGLPWVSDYKHWNYEAAIKATEAVYKVKPDLTREGGSIPVTLTFAESLGVNVLLLPMGRGDDGAHSTNEKLDKSNFIEGTKLLGTYLYEVDAISV